MKLSPDSSLDEWLGGLTGAAGQFDWDAGNRSKGQKHGVEASDVESLFRRTVFLAGRIVEPRHDDVRSRIAEALASCAGNQTRAAQALGMLRNALNALIAVYGLPRPRRRATAKVAPR